MVKLRQRVEYLYDGLFFRHVHLYNGKNVVLCARLSMVSIVNYRIYSNEFDDDKLIVDVMLMT